MFFLTFQILTFISLALCFLGLKKAFPILTFFFHFAEIDVFFFKIFAWVFVVAFFMFYFLKFNFVSFRFTNTGVFLEFLWAYFGYSFFWCFFAIFYDMLLFFW